MDLQQKPDGQKPDRQKASSATPWVGGLVWGFGSVSPSLFLGAFCVFAFPCSSFTCKFEFESSLCMLLRSHSFWFAGIARWAVARRWKDIGSLVGHSTFSPFLLSAYFAMSSVTAYCPGSSSLQICVDCCIFWLALPLTLVVLFVHSLLFTLRQKYTHKHVEEITH
jgi:hypothetical protein